MPFASAMFRSLPVLALARPPMRTIPSKQDKNETRADHLTYNLKSESVKGRGVNMTFQPKTK